MGRRGLRRAQRHFTMSAQLDGYRSIIDDRHRSCGGGGHEPGPDTTTEEVVTAKLGGAPQDSLLAAVVLEAWGGRSTNVSLHEAQALSLSSRTTEPPTATGPRRTSPVHHSTSSSPLLCWSPRSSCGFLFSMAMWMPTCATSSPLRCPPHWGYDRFIRVRYLGDRQAAALRPAIDALIAIWSLALAVAWFLGTAQVVGVCLAGIWSRPSVLLARGWPAVFPALVGIATAALFLDAPAVAVIVTVFLATTALDTWAVLSAEPDRRLPKPASLAVMGALIGVANGRVVDCRPVVVGRRVGFPSQRRITGVVRWGLGSVVPEPRVGRDPRSARRGQRRQSGRPRRLVRRARLCGRCPGAATRTPRPRWRLSWRLPSRVCPRRGGRLHRVHPCGLGWGVAACTPTVGGGGLPR